MFVCSKVQHVTTYCNEIAQNDLCIYNNIRYTFKYFNSIKHFITCYTKSRRY